jgi:endonuclease/exonuclease/phosphatase family metal-dependent hydrolase
MDDSTRACLRLLTYNIDGLNPVNLLYRTHHALALIISEDPDVIQLQEVIQETASLLSSTLSCNGYACLSEPSLGMCHYFTMTFFRKDKFNNVRMRRAPYSGAAMSQQGRDSLQLELQYSGTELLFVNCHLESCGVAFKSAGSTARVAQLRSGLQQLKDHASTGPAILSGDLNIREPEAAAVTGAFVGQIADAASGLEKKPSNTWYMPGPSRYSARYDRVYYNTTCGLIPTSFKVIGGEDIYPAGSEVEFGSSEPLPYRTVSDHRGLVVTFQFTTTEPSGQKRAVHESTVHTTEQAASGSGITEKSGSSGSVPPSIFNATNSANIGSTTSSGGTTGTPYSRSGASLNAQSKVAAAGNSSVKTTEKRDSAVSSLGKRQIVGATKGIPLNAEVICLDSDSSEDEREQASKRGRDSGVVEVTPVTSLPSSQTMGVPSAAAVTSVPAVRAGAVDASDTLQEDRRRRRELLLRAAEARCA